MTCKELERNGYIKLGRAKVARPGSIAWWTVCGIECAGLLMIVATAIGLAWILQELQLLFLWVRLWQSNF